MKTVTLNESGYDTGMEFDEYCQEAAKHGDNPADWSTNVDDFVFVSVEYGKQDPNWQDAANDQDWPEDLPLWEYRPNG